MSGTADVGHERIAAAMQAAWNDFVGDTGCYPDCFERHGLKFHADFTKGNFARMVANYLEAPDGA